MEDLTNLPNIGKVLAVKLHAIGINNYDRLADTGSIEAVLKIREDDLTACYNMLYAIEGAIRGIRWHSISKEDRERLRNEFDVAKGFKS